VGTKPMIPIRPSKPANMLTSKSTMLQVSDGGLDEGLDGRMDHVFGPLQEKKKR
jgi:hypothetical protein